MNRLTGWDILGIVLLVIVIVAATFWLVQTLWNAVMPALGLPTLTYWQAAGLFWLAYLLFGMPKYQPQS